MPERTQREHVRPTRSTGSKRILIVSAGRHGSAAEVAEAIGEELTREDRIRSER
jgi:hypothetical protein